MKAFGRMLDVLDTLREKCPWDRKQTNESLRPNTIEETYELCDALIKGDTHDICKELGDVLLHIAFYARIGEENAQFDIADVCNALVDKLVFRHPHVYHPSQVGAECPRPLPYGETQYEREFSKVDNVAQVLDNWEQIKQREKDGNKSVLAGVPAALPSVIKAYRIQDKARHVGFDWEDRGDVWEKVREELGELETELKRSEALDAGLETEPKRGEALDAGLQQGRTPDTDRRKTAQRRRTEGELGDFLFSVINAARLYKLNPDNALEMTNQKFIRRFNYIEQHSIKVGRPLTEMTLQEMDALWNEAKQHESDGA